MTQPVFYGWRLAEQNCTLEDAPQTNAQKTKTERRMTHIDTKEFDSLSNRDFANGEVKSVIRRTLKERELMAKRMSWYEELMRSAMDTIERLRPPGSQHEIELLIYMDDALTAPLSDDRGTDYQATGNDLFGGDGSVGIGRRAASSSMYRHYNSSRQCRPIN